MSADDFPDVGDMLPAAAGRDIAQASAQAQALIARETASDLVRYLAANRFPRDVLTARANIQNAFSRPRLAEAAQYEYAKGGTDVRGPSIRSAETLAQYWGHIGHGYKVVEERKGDDGVPVSSVWCYAVDYQSGDIADVTFTVRHWRTTRSGGYPLKDDREIYELIANMAARRKRACILAVIPADVVDDAMDQAATTLAARADTSPEAMQKMVEAFGAFGVTREHLEKFIQRNLDSISPAQVVTLKRVYVSLRDGMSVPGRWFDMAGAEGADGAGAGGSLAAVKGALAGDNPPASRPVPVVSEPPPPAPPDTRRSAPPRRRPPDPDREEHPRAKRMTPADVVRMFANDNGEPDAAAMLHHIAHARDMSELEGMDEAIAHYRAADRAILIEATQQRERALSSTSDNEEHQ